MGYHDHKTSVKTMSVTHSCAHNSLVSVFIFKELLFTGSLLPASMVSVELRVVLPWFYKENFLHPIKTQYSGQGQMISERKKYDNWLGFCKWK